MYIYIYYVPLGNTTGACVKIPFITFDHRENRSHSSSGDAVKATEVLSAMAVRRLVPNQHVYGAAIHACNRSRDAVPW